ncbi:hypothetical protein MTR67_048926 [Solanum verrucosum]|uniref:PB1 domain-containing protein n=1 Tax=Solanum verrucosum TaxID=315347 RepID=A0AAF0V2J0_SOLVR|nr:hypothetical protein MTR67_048926 [Solanum verrucosum]
MLDVQFNTLFESVKALQDWVKVEMQLDSIQDEDEDWILISTDSDLRDGMLSLRLLGRTTMRLLVTPGADT